MDGPAPGGYWRGIACPPARTEERVSAWGSDGGWCRLRRGRRCWCGRRVLALVQERGVPVPVPVPVAEGSMAVMMAPWW